MKMEDLCRGVVIDGRFKLAELLGSGSYGHVWRAEVVKDETGELPSEVALKVFKLQDSSDRFLFKEAATAKQFDHDRLVRVYGTGRIEGLPLMWMEFVPGSSLQKLLGDSHTPSPFPLDQVLEWLAGLAEGLALMHMKKVSHGDLKLDNVIVHPNRGVCLVDFGQSRQIRDIFVDTNGNGAHPYLAPEVLGREVGGEGKRYASSDIYAAGVIAYRILTGRFPRSTMPEVFNQVPFPKPRTLNPSVPRELDEIVMKCLEKKPRNRYQTGSDLLAAIEAFRRAVKKDQAVLNVLRPEHVPAPAAVEQLIAFAQELMQAGRIEDALNRLESGMQRMSTSPRLLLVYGEAAKRLKRYDTALYVFKRAVACMEQQNHPMEDRREAIEGLADVHVRMKQYDDAAPRYKELVDSYPDNRWYRYRYAIALGLEASDAGINESIKILQQLHEEEASALVAAKIGFAYCQKGDTNQACVYFNEALVYDRFETTALYHLGYIRCVQGQRDKAKVYLARLAQVDGAEDLANKLARQMEIDLTKLEVASE